MRRFELDDCVISLGTLTLRQSELPDTKHVYPTSSIYGEGLKAKANTLSGQYMQFTLTCVRVPTFISYTFNSAEAPVAAGGLSPTAKCC